MARTVLLLGLLGSAFAQETPYAQWIEQLAGAEPAKSEAARRILLHAGTRALGEIDRAQQAAQDEETRRRLAALAREIREREPFGLQFRCGMPKMRLTRDLVNSDEFTYAITVRNLGTETAILHAYLSLRVLDERGQEVRPARSIGRYGRRPAGCLLEKVEFVTVEPGEVWSFTAGLRNYVRDPERVTGWDIPAAGTYTLEFTHRFDRAAFRKRCPCGPEAHDDQAKPWNQALEFQHTFRAEMKVE